MCGGSSPPTPSAPPAPVPQRDSNIDGTMARQNAARRSSQSGYESTLLSGAGGVTSPATVAAPKLGTG